jgi:hypothetical protein
MDPAALGTLTLGLDAVRREELEDDQPIRTGRRRARRARRQRLARSLAGALRAMANVLEPALDPGSQPARRLTS